MILKRKYNYKRKLHQRKYYYKITKIIQPTHKPWVKSPWVKSPTLLLKKPLCMGDLSPASKKIIERPVIL